MKMIGYLMFGLGETNATERKVRLVQAGCDKVYTENESGIGRAATRRSLGHALRALKAGDVFVVEGINTVGRTDLEALQICAALLKRDVNIVAIDEGIDTRSSNDFRDKLDHELADKGVSEKKIKAAVENIEGAAVKTLRLKIREPELKVIAKMTAEGKHLSEIAEALGVHETAIRRHKRRLGIPKSPRPLLGNRMLSATEIPKLVRRIDAGESMAKLAAEYETNERTIRKTYEIAKGGATVRKVAADQLKVIARRVEGGESIRKIAADYGVSDPTIRNAYIAAASQLPDVLRQTEER